VPSLCWPNPGGWAKASGAVKIEPESQREHFDYSNRSEKVSIEEDEYYSEEKLGNFVSG
jgi:hypothetical protein